MATERKFYKLAKDVYLFDSADVRVFPSVNRVTDCDPESRMNSERNLTSLGAAGLGVMSRGGDDESYLVNVENGAETGTYILSAIIGGYRFEITYKYSDLIKLFGAPVEIAYQNGLYLFVQKAQYKFYEPVGQQAKYTTTLWSWANTNAGDQQSTLLDQQLGESGDDTWYFTGLAISNKTITPETGNSLHKLKIYYAGEENGTTTYLLDLQQRLPKIANGEGGNSIVLNDIVNNTTKKHVDDIDIFAEYAVAEGYCTKATGNCSHAEGDSTEASAASAHAEGKITKATKIAAHAEGYTTQATGQYSHAEGNDTIATNACAHAEGKYTAAHSLASHAEGCGFDTNKPNLAGNIGAHAEGMYTSATGEGAHAEGMGDVTGEQHNLASGTAAHAEGGITTAAGNYSHAEGLHTVANGKSQHVFGEFNVIDNTAATPGSRGAYVEIVGCGTAAADWARKNARTLDWDGNEKIYGSLTIGSVTTTTAAQGDADFLNVVLSPLNKICRRDMTYAAPAAVAESTGTTEITYVDSITADKGGKITESRKKTTVENGDSTQATFKFNGAEIAVKNLTANDTPTFVSAKMTGLIENQAVITNASKVLASKAISDSISPAAISEASDNFVTERDIYYGLPTINNSHTYNSGTAIYAPSNSAGTNQVLRGNGSYATPTWTSAGDNNQILTVSSGTATWGTVTNYNVDLAGKWGQSDPITLADIAGTQITIKMPPNPNTDTNSWRSIAVNDTQCLDNDAHDPGTYQLNLVNGSNVSITWEDSKVKISSTDTDTKYDLAAGRNQGQVTLKYLNAGGVSTVTATNLGTSGTPTFSSVNTTSDRRLKTNIKDFVNHKSILDLQVKEFDLVESNNRHSFGLIAQELQELYPELVHDRGDGYLAIEESKLVYLLIDEVKKLKKELEELKNK